MTFSGHDTFHCRLFWLKKGFDYVNSGESFKDDSGIELGVGRNMVNSIKFWMKSFDVLTENDQINPLYNHLFDNNSWDPYLENEGTLLLLHYELCSRNHSSIYNLIFQHFRKIKPEFTRKNFVSYVKDLDSSQNTKTLEKDFSVFLRMYGASKDSHIEDGYSGLFTELELLNIVGETLNKEKLYRLENKNQKDIPIEIILYCILSNDEYGKSISFKSLYSSSKGVGNIFCFDKDILEEKLIAITNEFDGITYQSEAGIKELQINDEVQPLTILQRYYV